MNMAKLTAISAAAHTILVDPCGGGKRAVRLMCDEMLLRLGRWLRAAGYDTAIAEGGVDDAAVIARCAAESRVLLTRDRRLAECAEGCVSVLRLAEDTIDEQATQAGRHARHRLAARAVHPLRHRQCR